jgi:hypothetical protein
MRVQADLGREERGVPHDILVAGVAVQPRPVRVGERLCGLRDCAVSVDALTEAGSTALDSATEAGAAGAGAVAGTVVAGMRFFSSALSSSISACIAANCFATAGDISGSGVAGTDAVFRGELGAARSDTLVSAGSESCCAATVVLVKVRVCATQILRETAIRPRIRAVGKAANRKALRNLVSTVIMYRSPEF